MEKIFITGATGYVGSKVLEILEKGYNINILTRGMDDDEYYDMPGGTRVEYFLGDIRNVNDIRRAMKGCTTVLHMAAEVSFNKADEKEVWDTNIKGTQNVVDVAQELGIKKIVYLSAAATRISKEQKIVTEGTRAEYPNDCPYIHSKLWAEGIIEHSRIPVKVVVYLSNTRVDLFEKTVNKQRVIFCPPGVTNLLSLDLAAREIARITELAKVSGQRLLHGSDMNYASVFNLVARNEGKKVFIVVLPQWTKNIVKFIASFSRSRFFTPYTVERAYSKKYFQSFAYSEERALYGSGTLQPALL